MYNLTEEQLTVLESIQNNLEMMLHESLTVIYAVRNAALRTARDYGIPDDFTKKLTQRVMEETEEIVSRAANESLEFGKD